MNPFHYNLPHHKPKPPRRKRVCISRAYQVTPDGKWLPMPQFPSALGQTPSVHALRRTLRMIMPAPKEFGRLVILSLTVPASEFPMVDDP
jgi:hypothetical protein